MIDLSQVRVLGGPPDPLFFPKTARLDSFGVVPGTMFLRTSGQTQWPPVDIDGNGTLDQAATLWIFLQIGGQWYAAGAERLRPAQVNGTKPNAHASEGGLSTLIGNGWFGDHHPHPIRGYNPAVGEVIGVMVAAGDSRLGLNAPLRARTDVICVEWRAGEAMREVWREGAAGGVGDPPPVVVDPPPAPPAGPDPALQALQQALATALVTQHELVTRVAALEADRSALQAGLAALQTTVAEVDARKIPTRTRPFRIPFGGTVTLALE